MFLDREIPSYSADELNQRKEQALRLLKDPFFNSVMDEAEAGAITEWLQNTDPAARERCWLLCKGLETVKLALRQVVGSAPLDTK